MVDRVVFWDFDGTLAGRQGKWTGALLTALTSVDIGHRVTATEIRGQLSTGFPWHDPARPHPEHNHPDAWWSAMRQTLRRAYRRVGVRDEVAQAAAGLVRDCYLEPARWTVDPQAAPALELLSDAGWEHVLLSNHVPELPELVDKLGLGRHFSHVLTSARTGYEKPHPAAFALAIEVAGDPKTAWMVGDNPVADIAGARAAGLRAVRVGRDTGASLAAAARLILSS